MLDPQCRTQSNRGQRSSKLISAPSPRSNKHYAGELMHLKLFPKCLLPTYAGKACFLQQPTASPTPTAPTMPHCTRPTMASPPQRTTTIVLNTQASSKLSILIRSWLIQGRKGANHLYISLAAQHNPSPVTELLSVNLRCNTSILILSCRLQVSKGATCIKAPTY